MIEFDDVDNQIIEILTHDARTSNRQVARVVGLSEAAVRWRLKRLAQTGAAKITAVIDPSAVGLRITAFVRMKIKPANLTLFADLVCGMEFVSFAAITSGRYNLLVVVNASDRRTLALEIDEHFRSHTDVHEIEALEPVENIKHRLDLTLINAPEEI